MSATATEAGVDLGRYARVLRRRWYVVVLAGLLGLVLGWAYLVVQPREAAASALVNVTVISQDPFELTREPSGLIDAQTEIQTVQSSAVVTRAAQELGGGLTPAELRAGLEAELYPDATVVRITYTADTVEEATEGADEIALQFLDYRSELAVERVESTMDRLSARRDLLRDDLLRVDQEIGDARPGSREALQAQADRDVIRSELDSLLAQMATFNSIDTSAGSVLTAASDVGAYVSPTASSALPIGALVGLLVGLVLAFARDALDGRVRDESDLARVGVGPVLARLPARATVPPQPGERDELRSAWEQLTSSLVPEPTVAVVEPAGARTAHDVPANLACAVVDQGGEVELVVVGAARHGIRELEHWLGLEVVEETPEGLRFVADGRPGLAVRWVAGDRLPADLATRAGAARPVTPRATILDVSPEASRATLLAAAKVADATVVVPAQGRSSRASLRQLSGDVAAVAGNVVGSLVVPGRRTVSGSRPDREPRPDRHAGTPTGAGVGDRV